VTYRTLKSDPYLEDWKAARGRFQGSTWTIETRHWSRLTELLTKHNPGFAGFYSSLEQQPRYKRPKNERHIEDRLEADLHVLSRFGHDLKLVKRQFICEPVGRIDLLCRDRSTGCYVVIELKDERASLSTFGQVGSV